MSDEKRAALEALGLTSAEAACVVDFVESWDDHSGPLLFVGAGLSRHESERKPGVPEDVKIADWVQFTAQLQGAAPPDDQNLGGRPRDPPAVAQLYVDAAGRQRLIDRLARAIPYKDLEPGPAHRALLGIQWAAVITTNYDDLLERTFQEAGRPVWRIIDDRGPSSRQPSTDAVEIVKMHGCLELDPGSVVASSADYRDYERDRPLLMRRVQTHLAEHPILFLGFSLTDPNVTSILEWLLQIQGDLRLPAVSLVHVTPSDEQRAYWGERKVRLVRLPDDCSVSEFLEALSRTWRPQASAAPGTRRPFVARVAEAVAQSTAARADVLVQLVSDVLTAGSEDEQREATAYVLGSWDDLTPVERDTVLAALDEPKRRALLLAALRFGIVERQGLNVEEKLLDQPGLQPSERCEVLVLRAERELTRGDLDTSRTDLKQASELGDAAGWNPNVREHLRRLLLRLGDEQLIQSELLAPPDSDDASAHARRGADLLITAGRGAARRWYEKAHRIARNADEKTAALLGLQACAAPGEWKNLSEYDPNWQAISADTRPRTDEINELDAEAGAELLKGYRDGAGSHGLETSLAVDQLERALRLADDMGWPRSLSPNFTGPLDALAYSAVGLLVRPGADINDLRRGLDLFIERSLLQVHRRLRVDELDRLLASDIDWTRGFLSARQEAAYKRKSRDVLTSALLPALTDDCIAAHLERVLEPSELEGRNAFNSRPTAVHLELIHRHYHALPTGPARQLVQLVARVFSEEDLAIRRRDQWMHLPIYDWTTTGVLDPNDGVLRPLVDAVSGFYQRGKPDWLENNQALALLDELKSANALLPGDKDAIVATLDEVVIEGLQSDMSVSSVLAMARARQEMQPGLPPALLVERFCGMYSQLRNSTAAGTWMNVLDHVGQHLDAGQARNAAENIRDYLRITLGDREGHIFGPFPEWAATAIHQGAKGGLLQHGEARELLDQLAKEFPACIAFAIGMPGFGLEDAQSRLLDALARRRTDLDAVHRWCVWLPEHSAPSPELERALLGFLLSQDPAARQRAYWSLRWLARKDSLTAESRRDATRFVFDYGIDDLEPKPRAAAVVAASELHAGLDEDTVTRFLQRATEDSHAMVRRAAGLLRKTLGE